MHALGLEFGSAAQLSKRPGSVWNCLWGNALKRSPGIIRKSRVSYPGPGFLSSATWPALPKKHYNGLNLNQRYMLTVSGDQVTILLITLVHVLYFVMVVVSASFLRTPMFSRMVMLVLIPLNAMSEVRQSKSLGFAEMTLFISITVMGKAQL